MGSRCIHNARMGILVLQQPKLSEPPMSSIARFVFSAFHENTYVVADPSGACAIIDPGCGEPAEQKTLADYIEAHGLKPEWLLNTHCHIDHVLGNAFVAQRWGLELAAHAGERVVLEAAEPTAKAYGIPFTPSPRITQVLEAGDTVRFGSIALEVRFVPGHSPAHIVFHNAEEGYCLCGDTLFEGSIGRTDLPGGDTNTLMTSITEQLLSLPPETRLLPGHMGETTVEREAANNPFVQAWKAGKPI